MDRLTYMFGKLSILFFALYGHVRSYAQSKHRLAFPASTGLRALRKCNSDPKEETRFSELGVSQWHIKSMSLGACQRTQDTVHCTQDVLTALGHEREAALLFL